MWLTSNRLVLNVNKSSFMIINLNHHNIQDIFIEIDGKMLPCVTSAKVLGLYFDDRMCFDEHIHKTSAKMLRRVGVLSRLKGILSKKLMLSVYNSIVIPLFDYGSVVYGFTYKEHLNCMEILQKRALRIVFSAGFRDHCQPIFKSLKVMPLLDRINYNSCLYIFKAMNNLSSKYSNGFFKLISHSHSTRAFSDKKVYVPNVRL